MRRRTLALLTGPALLLGLLAPAATAVYDPQTELFAAPGLEIRDTLLSPDGTVVAFTTGDTAGGDAQAVWTVRVDGTTPAPVRLSDDEVAPTGEIEEFLFTPDSSRVVWFGDIANGENVGEVFSAPVMTPDAQVVLGSPPRMGTGGVREVTMSPDSLRVVYRADYDDVDGVNSLHSAPVDTAGQEVQLSSADPSTSDGVMNAAEFTPDGSHVVYEGDLDGDSVPEGLYAAPVDAAGQQVRLTPTAEPSVVSRALLPPGDDVVVIGEFVNAGKIEVFRTDLDGNGPMVPLSTSIAEGDVQINSTLQLTADGERVVYLGDLAVNERQDLWSIPVDGSTAQVRLSATDGNPAGRVGSFLLSDDGTRVFYTGDLAIDEVRELYSAPVDAGGGQVQLSQSDGRPGSLVQNLRPTADGTRIVYTGFFGADSPKTAVYSAPVARSGGQVELSSNTRDIPSIIGLTVSPDSSWVGYRGRLTPDGTFTWYVAPVGTPGGQIPLTTAAESAAVLAGSSLEFSPDGSRVLLAGDFDPAAGDEIVSISTGSTDRTVVSQPMPVGATEIRDMHVLPDSSAVVYAADLQVTERFDLFASGVGQLPARAVTDITTSEVGTDTVTLSWTRPPFDSQVTSYRITVEPTTRRVTTTVDGDTSVATITGLTEDTDYTATVVAVNDAGNSPVAATTFTTDAVEPDPTDPEPAGGVVRLSGETRFDTAAAVALDRFDPDDVTTVFLATGRNFPDALAGGPLAAHLGAAILLVEPGSLPDITASTLATLDPDQVIALGGTVAIADTVLTAAGTAADATTSRLSGDTRYATATAIADALLAAGGNVDDAYLAIGTNFPDAVAAGPATASAPILLTPGTALADETRTWLTTNTPDRIVGVGGDQVLTTDTLGAAALAAADEGEQNASAVRRAGDTRYATATTLASASFTNPTTVYLAVGTNYPDALTGGPAANAEGAPVVLTAGGATELPGDTLAYLDALSSLRRIVVLGGTTAIPDAVLVQLESLLDE